MAWYCQSVASWEARVRPFNHEFSKVQKTMFGAAALAVGYVVS